MKAITRLKVETSKARAATYIAVWALSTRVGERRNFPTTEPMVEYAARATAIHRLIAPSSAIYLPSSASSGVSVLDDCPVLDECPVLDDCTEESG